MAVSALVASALMSPPRAIATSMSGSTVDASTPAHFSLDGTNREFAAAVAWAVASSLPPTSVSSDFLAGSRPRAASFFW
jgi:hypothetical protein